MSGARDHRRREVHALDEHGMIACNPRDREAAHRADVGDIASSPRRAAVTCKKCLTALGRAGR